MTAAMTAAHEAGQETAAPEAGQKHEKQKHEKQKHEKQKHEKQKHEKLKHEKQKQEKQKHEKHAIPDFDGARFCRHCNARIPLALFPKDKRRYVCRQHAWQHIKKPHKARVAADARRALLFKQWQRCYADAKTFQHARIGVTQEDLARLLAAAGLEDPTAMAAVPRDPGRVLSNDNAVVVPNEARKKLLRTRRRQGSEAYTTALAHIGATCAT